MLKWLHKWREKRRQRLLERLEDEDLGLTEADRWDRRHDATFQGGAGGSGRRTTYDEGHTHDEWS